MGKNQSHLEKEKDTDGTSDSNKPGAEGKEFNQKIKNCPKN